MAKWRKKPVVIEAEVYAAGMRDAANKVVADAFKWTPTGDKEAYYYVGMQSLLDLANSLNDTPAGASLLAEVRELRAKVAAYEPALSKIASGCASAGMIANDALDKWQYRGEGDAE